MRVYFPIEAGQLRRLLAERRLGLPTGYAVTPSLRAWFGTGDVEEYEHAASFRAGDAAAALGGRDRLVLPVDVPDAAVRDAADPADPGAVAVAGDIELGWVAAILAGDDEELSWYGVQEADQLLG